MYYTIIGCFILREIGVETSQLI